MSVIDITIVALILVVGMGLIIFAVRQMNQSKAISERLDQYTDVSLSLEELELQQPFSERVLKPLFRSLLTTLGRFGLKQNQERLRVNLQLAGNPGNITPNMFIGLRMALAISLLVVVGLLVIGRLPFMQALMGTLIAAMIGYILPGIWLDRKIKERKKNILKALPDALDLLCISVEAGLAFDLALQRVAQKWDNELSREFQRVLQDIRLGRTRREALRDLVTRTGVEDVQTFVSAVIQADQLGVSMSKILRIQSDQLRVRRRQRAEEAAQKAPVKMLIPMVFLIFPALFVVILGPAVPRIMQALGVMNSNMGN
ncbi:type II secretion system F family protein [Chloroflexus sp. MS-CIW-1]|jgi:tight adherence protein C|uniref:type II secretion system F family protein n=1 Tax=unclassified Chloroflexus TaxID=2633855 RepID=UPI0004DF221B|nr:MULTISPECIES: type II secretion system F family protein [unclassified Chloroflexus]MDN5271684.1 type II secretion system F family protein [Chloroflexus sp. MS-CIW-1]